MAKRASQRHTAFISVVFLPSEGRAVERAAKKAHMKKSAFVRQVVLERIEEDQARRRK